MSMIARLTPLDVRLNFRLTHRRYYASKPEISTLLPQKLRPTDMLEGLPQAFEKYYQEPIPQHPEKSLALRHRGSCIAWEPRPPPKSCRGFLYYHEPEPAPRLAGSMRFRLTPSFDPDISPQAAFAAGSDLQIPKAGLPWSVPLWTLLRVPSLAHFRGVLHADGVQTIDPKSKVIADLNETSVLLYALGQPFLVEFHMFYLRVYLFRGTGPALCGRIESGFFDPTSPSYRQPYLGLAVVTLERLDDSLGLRIQKILSLSQQYINPNIAPPVEGEIRPLRVAPVLFKEATKPTHPKFLGPQRYLMGTLGKLPHVSEMTVP